MAKITIDTKDKHGQSQERTPSSISRQKKSFAYVRKTQGGPVGGLPRPAASRGGWSPPSSPAGSTREDTLMDNTDNIRHACILAPSGYDNHVLVHSLMAAASGTTEVNTVDQNLANVSFSYEMTKTSSDLHKGQIHEKKFFVNLIQAPGHVDDPVEATEVLSMADGALIIIDCVEGFAMHPHSVVCHALRERIRPLLCLNLIDRCFFDPQVNGEQTYQLLLTTINNANGIMSKYKDKLLVDVQVYPQKGSVIFCSGTDLSGWGFTLTTFAKYYAQNLGIDESKAMGRLWGDSFYDSQTRQWTNKHTGAETCTRGFVRLCYEPIKEIVDICMSNDRPRLRMALEHRGLVLSDEEDQYEGEDLLNCFMKLWLPAGKSVLDMMVLHLPSPLKAQEYRVENLYTGPLNDSYASAIRNCDPNGPLVMYISKMISTSNKRTFALGRVFSGKFESGMRARVMGSNHVPGDKYYHIESLQCAQIFDGKKLKSVKCGNIVTLVGLNKCIPNAATVTKENMLHAFPLRTVSIDLEHDEILPDVTFKGMDNLTQDLRIPYLLYNDLFLHQREGIRWLWTMHCKDSGGILADDMGLGKTRQVSTFLHGLFYSKLINRAIVIAPPSVIESWGEELEHVGITNNKKFVDAKSKRHLKQVVTEGGVLCTTYGMFTKIEDEDESDPVLRDAQGVETWDYVFMDEGHRAKNSESQISKSLKNMKCKHKIIMTGTPMQNNLEEFHTLMDICKPSLLDERLTFHRNYVLPINRGKHRDAEPHLKAKSAQLSARLAKLTNPFVLRRTKELLKAQGHFPSNKYEYTIWLELTPCQVEYYEALVTNKLLRILGYALPATKIARDICRHPYILTQKYSEDQNSNEDQKNRVSAVKIKNSVFKMLPPNDLCEGDSNISSKLNFILYLLPKLTEEKHKVLVFSQCPHMLKILQKALGNIMDREKIIRMDGSTKRRDRNTMITLFQGEDKDKSKSGSSRSGSSRSSGSGSSNPELSNVSEPCVFLMTTRVGGVGLNLTAATCVIIADPSENPSDDIQAVDRAYRIGQLDNVIVYRLVNCATIEEHTYREQILKIEGSFGILGEQPCMKAICEREERVLSLPPNGFSFCKTHRELVRIYGSEMEVKLSSDLHVRHKFAIAANNHSLLFSVKEDMENGVFKPQHIDINEEKPMLKGRKKKEAEAEVPRSTRIQLSQKAVDRLLAYKKSRLKKLQRATEAAMDIYKEQMLISSHDLQEIRNARNLVNDFLQKLESEKMIVIYIPKAKDWVVMGKHGCTLTSIMDESQAFVVVKDPEKGRRDLYGQKAVQISGNLRTINAAKNMILEKLKVNRVQYTIEEEI